MEKIRDENGRFKPGHPGQKPSDAKSELRKKVLSFVEERWEQLPEWFDTLKAKDSSCLWLNFFHTSCPD